MPEQHDEINTLLGRMLQKRLYVVFSTPLQPMSEMRSLLQEHLSYMIELEKRGLLFASGPFLAEGQELPGSGMSILRVASRAEAEAIAQEDPIYKNGMRN